MHTRPCLILLTLAAACLPAVSAAQQSATGSGAGAAAASPYAQQRSPAYTSFDNPYAPGGLYDPYRSNRALNQSQNRSSTLFGGKAGSDPTRSSLSRHSELGQDDTLGGSLQGSSHQGPCSSTSRLGGSLSSSMNRSAPGGYGSASRCTGSAGSGYGSTSLSGRSRSSGLGSGGLSSRKLKSSKGTAASVQQQQMDRLQQLPQ